jgi:hypothetical protein
VEVYGGGEDAGRVGDVSRGMNRGAVAARGVLGCTGADAGGVVHRDGGGAAAGTVVRLEAEVEDV